MGLVQGFEARVRNSVVFSEILSIFQFFGQEINMLLIVLSFCVFDWHSDRIKVRVALIILVVEIHQ